MQTHSVSAKNLLF